MGSTANHTERLQVLVACKIQESSLPKTAGVQIIPLKSPDIECGDTGIRVYSHGLHLCFGLVVPCCSPDLLFEMGMYSACHHMLAVYNSYFDRTRSHS